VSWGEVSHLENPRNSIDPAAPSGSTGILATRTTVLIGVSRAEFSSASSSSFTSHRSIYLSIYLPVSSLPPRSTYLLERPLHVFVVCSPCCFYEAPYTAPVPYPSTTARRLNENVNISCYDIFTCHNCCSKLSVFVFHQLIFS